MCCPESHNKMRHTAAKRHSVRQFEAKHRGSVTLTRCSPCHTPPCNGCLKRTPSLQTQANCNHGRWLILNNAFSTAWRILTTSSSARNFHLCSAPRWWACFCDISRGRGSGRSAHGSHMAVGRWQRSRRTTAACTRVACPPRAANSLLGLARAARAACSAAMAAVGRAKSPTAARTQAALAAAAWAKSSRCIFI